MNCSFVISLILGTLSFHNKINDLKSLGSLGSIPKSVQNLTIPSKVINSSSSISMIKN